MISTKVLAILVGLVFAKLACGAATSSSVKQNPEYSQHLLASNQHTRLLRYEQLQQQPRPAVDDPNNVSFYKNNFLKHIFGCNFCVESGKLFDF
jgi:UDP-N-acetylglucosamine pyrophosphorylase